MLFQMKKTHWKKCTAEIAEDLLQGIARWQFTQTCFAQAPALTTPLVARYAQLVDDFVQLPVSRCGKRIFNAFVDFICHFLPNYLRATQTPMLKNQHLPLLGFCVWSRETINPAPKVIRAAANHRFRRAVVLHSDRCSCTR